MRYHNKLFYSSTAESEMDADGNFPSQQSEMVFAGYCREESNSSGRKVAKGDGTHIEYSNLIYTPADCHEMKPNDVVEVRDNTGKVRVSGTVLRFSRDRYNCRLWL